MSFAKKFCLNVKSCNKILCSSYASLPTAPISRRSLVEELKYKFRIKSAQKKDLLNAQQGLTPLTKITVHDVRSIWIQSLVAEQGLPLHKVFLSKDMFAAMDLQLRKVLTIDENDLVEFEDFLPTMVCLIRTKVTQEDEEEISKELFDFWFPDKASIPGLAHGDNGTALEELKAKTNHVITSGSPNYENIKNIKEMKTNIKKRKKIETFLEGSGFDMWLD